jgi:deoxyribodipyrimidine photo-lyase
MTLHVPPIRVRNANEAPARSDGRYVLYWMTACRRAHDSFALDRAVAWACELDRPLVVLEALRCGYRYASDRFHAFVIEGMADNREAFDRPGVKYLSYVERGPGEGSGLLEALAAHACVVVTDEYPTFFLPKMIARAAGALPVRLEVVDGCGLLPLAAAPRAFPRAYGFRRFLQRELRHHLAHAPSRDPLAKLPAHPPSLPKLTGWSMVVPSIASLPIDHSVSKVETAGGSVAALARMKKFVASELDRYEERSHPDAEVESRLSPYLHFGYLSTHRVFDAVARHEGWSLDKLPTAVTGKKEWGMSAPAQEFLDQLVTWRELGYVHCAKVAEHAEYTSLPAWAQKTLKKHARDERLAIYPRQALENAETNDPLWNAAQRQLRAEGRIHNALRMLWGKRVLEWTRTPEEAHEVLFYLNDRWALDGRDPNSVTGIQWIFGAFDRAWGPERPIFGTVRYMSSAAQKKKLHLRGWLERFGQ